MAKVTKAWAVVLHGHRRLTAIGNGLSPEAQFQLPLFARRREAQSYIRGGNPVVCRDAKVVPVEIRITAKKGRKK